jgi:hypothetical protein
MGKFFFSLLICLSLSILSQAQPVIVRGGNANTQMDYRLMAAYNLFVPRFKDTSFANVYKGIDTSGGLIYCFSDQKLYYRGSNPKKWIEIGLASNIDTTIYNGDGTLSGRRIVDANNNSLLFTNVDTAFFTGNKTWFKTIDINPPYPIITDFGYIDNDTTEPLFSIGGQSTNGDSISPTNIVLKANGKKNYFYFLDKDYQEQFVLYGNDGIYPNRNNRISVTDVSGHYGDVCMLGSRENGGDSYLDLFNPYNGYGFYYGTELSSGSDTAATRAYARSVGGGTSSLDLQAVTNNGATTTNDITVPKLNATSVNITGVNGNGHLHLKHQSSDATATGQSTSLFANSSGYLKWKNDGNYYSTLATPQTANRVYTFQDKSYTLADSADLASKVNISDTSTMLSKYLRKVDTASLSSRIDAKGNGTVTSVATGYGLSGGTITSTGTLLVDSATLGNKFARLSSNNTLTGANTFQSSQTASGAIARGTYFNHTLTAAANNDVLVGVDISNTYNRGAFTGVADLELRTNRWLQVGVTNNTGLIIGATTFSSNLPTSGFRLTYNTGNGATYTSGSGGGFYHDFVTNSTSRFRVNDATTNVANNLYVGNISTAATAYLHIKAGTASANTAPLKLTSGTNLTTVENGAIEYDGSDLYVSANSTRQKVNKGLNGSYSATGTATTSFTVTFGGTQPNSTYKVIVTPTNALTAAMFYVTSKTTTTFTVTFLSGLTGTVAFDWCLIQ